MVDEDERKSMPQPESGSPSSLFSGHSSAPLASFLLFKFKQNHENNSAVRNNFSQIFKIFYEHDKFVKTCDVKTSIVFSFL